MGCFGAEKIRYIGEDWATKRFQLFKAFHLTNILIMEISIHNFELEIRLIAAPHWINGYI